MIKSSKLSVRCTQIIFRRNNILSLIVSVFIATSLDGFIARENDSLDWLDDANKTLPIGEDCAYEKFMQGVDALVMGRHTYEKVLTFKQWPYKNKRVIVLSSTKLKIPNDLSTYIEHSSLSGKELCASLEKEGLKRICVDGGITIQRFLSAKLIKDLTLTIIPVLIGNGKPLFSSLIKDIKLKLQNTKAYDFGFVQMKYQIIEQ